MTILITGVAGFIGSHLAKYILNNTDYKVVGVDDLSGGFIENLPEQNERFKFFNNSVCNGQQIDMVFKLYKPQFCFHAGAYASEGRSNHIRAFITYNNTFGSQNIINACVNYNCKLVFFSSVAVYSGRPPFSEAIPPNPIDEYALSKFMTEKSIEIANKTQGLNYCIIRPRNVYGPQQNIFDPSRNLFGIACYKALTNQTFTIFGDGSNRRSFTYIDDIIEPIFNAIKVDNEIINLGASKDYSVKQAIDLFSSITGYKNIIHVEPRHEVAEAYCLTHLSEELLGYKDITSLEEGITKMWAWAKEQKLKPLMQPPVLEVTKNVHSSLL